MLFRTDHGSNIPQNSSSMATYPHLTNHSGRMSKTCWRSKDELINDIIGLLDMDTPALVNQQRHYVNTGCHLENLPWAIGNSDRWWKRVKGICIVSIIMEKFQKTTIIKMMSEEKDSNSQRIHSWVLDTNLVICEAFTLMEIEYKDKIISYLKDNNLVTFILSTDKILKPK